MNNLCDFYMGKNSAARVLGVKPFMLKFLSIPFVKIERRVCYRRSAVLAFLKRMGKEDRLKRYRRLLEPSGKDVVTEGSIFLRELAALQEAGQEGHCGK